MSTTKDQARSRGAAVPGGAKSAPGTTGPGPAPVAGVAVKRRWPHRALVLANIMVLVMLIAGGSAYGYVRWQLDKTHHIAVKGLTLPKSSSSPMTILAVGSDTRNLGKGDSASFGSDTSVTGQRSDTIMLLRVVPATSSVAILSIPRDLLVPVAGLGTTRINAAFNSGPNLLISTLKQVLGIQINHYMVVNFYTFTQISDALGGVYQYFPTPARDLNSGLTVTKPGCVLLTGANALGFVRSREYQYLLDGQWQYQMSPESDLARIQRQQDFVKLAVKKAEHLDPANIGAVNKVISGITSSLTVDNSFSTSLMLELADTFRHTNVNGIANWTYPTVNSTEVPGALDPDPAADQAMISEFLNYGLPSAAGTSSGSTATTASAAGLPTGHASRAAAGAKTVAGLGVVAGSEVSLAADIWLAQPLAANEVASSSQASSQASSSQASSSQAAVGETTPADQVYADASSYYEGQYIPPGRLPNQVPEQCPS